MNEKIKFDYSSKMKPLKHQLDAIRAVGARSSVPLFDEQGLGKSKIVIDALCNNIRDGELDGALVVCKKTLLYTWKKEVEKHSHLFPVVIDGSRRQRGRTIVTYGHFYIVNYESLIQEMELITLLLKYKRFAIVLDESQKIKNPLSQTSKAILSLRNLAKKRIIITGTPIANKPEDIWTQFFFLDDGDLLGDDFNSFKRQYGTSLKGVQDMSSYEDDMKLLREKIASVSIRRTKDVLELPEKTYEDVVVELDGKQRSMYETARKEMYYEISNEDGTKIERDIDNYLVKLLRLTQIASNPGLLDSGYDEQPAKFTALDKIVEEIMTRNEKVIVWTSFVDNVRTLKNRFKEYGPRMLFGEIPIQERNAVVEKFMDDPGCRILIANPAAAKEGLTLTSANNAIYVDRTFKMDDYVQSQDRIHRIGQVKRCRIIKLIADGTIDEYTDEILEKKELLAGYTLGDTDRIEGGRQYMSKEDLLRIIGG